MKTMTTTDFAITIMVDQTPAEALDAIANVPGWWNENFKGSAKNLDDVFSIQFGETWVDFKIVEWVPETKAVWLVTDCYLHWLADKKEWNGTRIAWEIATVGKATEITMTHVGLVPEIECFENCKKGWNFFIGESLFKLLTENKGLPSTPKDDRDQ
jgi:hypothetical protein